MLMCVIEKEKWRRQWGEERTKVIRERKEKWGEKRRENREKRGEREINLFTYG